MGQLSNYRIIFFDVNKSQTFNAIDVWFKEMSKSTGDAFGMEKFLLVTGTDTPGLRVILPDDAENYSKLHQLPFFEVR